MHTSALPLISPWLSDASDWPDTLRAGHRRSFAKHQVLFSEADHCAQLMLVLDGRVRLVSTGAEGWEGHLLVVSPGSVIGDCGLFGNRRYAMTARASTAVTVAMLDADTLRRSIQHDAGLAQRFLEVAHLRQRILLQHYRLANCADAFERVCFHLLGLASAHGSQGAQGIRLELDFTQQEMAEICCLSRVSVSQAFGRLEALQAIRREPDRRWLIEPQRMRGLVAHLL
ncbi:Crp/Fnr family transcriptional regulator [Pseudomonas putida]|uniref:Crp/Fnr family transcriptional regulator n=1 Tax=Pseudomonas putida TaxID=303 RepID=UPI00383B4ECE